MSSTEVSIRLSLKDADTVHKGLVSLGPAGERAMERIARATPRASRTLNAFNRTTREVRNGFDLFAARLGPVGAGLTALGPAGLAAAAGIAGVALALKALSTQTRQALSDIQALQKEANIAGVGVEAFQELSAVARDFSVTTEELSDGLKELQIRADEFAVTGKGPGAEAFERLGFTQQELAEGLKDTTGLFTEVISRIEELDGAAQLRVLDEVFGGQAGEKFVGVLEGGAVAVQRIVKEARAAGEVIDKEMVQRSEETRRELERMEKIIDVQLTQAFVDLGPILVEFVGYFAEAARLVSEIVSDFKDLDQRPTSVLEARSKELSDQIRTIEAATNLPGASLGVGESRRAARIAELQGELDQITEVLVARNGSKGRPRGSRRGTNTSANPIQDTIKNLEFERAQLGRTDIGRSIFTALRQAGLENVNSNDVEVQRIRELVTEIQNLTQAEKDLEAARKEGARLTESLETAEETYQREVTETNALLQQGAIDAQTAARAHEDAENRKLDASRKAADGIQRAVRNYVDQAGDAATSFDQITTDAFVGFEDAIIGLADSTETASQRMVNALRGIAEELARIGIRRTITVPLADAIFGSADGGGGGFLSGLFHTGGIAGSVGPSRRVSPLLFAGAPRFHSGGLVGGSEVPAILRKGEEVLTENDPRHRRNFGMMGGVVINSSVSFETPPTNRDGQPDEEVMAQIAEVIDQQIDSTATRVFYREAEKSSRRGRTPGRVGNVY